jgi:hypothetical protein
MAALIAVRSEGHHALGGGDLREKIIFSRRICNSAM